MGASDTDAGMPYKIKSIVTRKLEGVKHFHYYLCRRLGGGMEIIMHVVEIGRNIAFARKKAGLTQEGLAERISVTAQAVSKWENGHEEPISEMSHDRVAEGKPCDAFQMEDVEAAREHMDYEIVRNYGDYANGHYLHTWDEGERFLAKCKNCGGYILVQRSEFHDMVNGDDSYYVDYFPVNGQEAADKINRDFDGFELERKFPGRYLMKSNLRWHWSVREK